MPGFTAGSTSMNLLNSRIRQLLAILVLFLIAHPFRFNAAPDVTEKTKQEWSAYIDLTEKRIERELKSATVALRSDLATLKSGKIVIEPMTTPGSKGKDIADGTIHHWIGSIYFPKTTLEKVMSEVQNYAGYQDYFKDVEKSSGSRSGDNFKVFLRITRTKIITVHFNTDHDAIYTRRGAGLVSSVSRSTKIQQIIGAGTPQERLYPEGKDDGYLWALNSYWRFFERDGGVVIESESVGLSRSLGWGYGLLNIFTLGTIRRTANSIAREALESTLSDLRNMIVTGTKKPQSR
jgi:hypothetical protein